LLPVPATSHPTPHAPPEHKPPRCRRQPRTPRSPYALARHPSFPIPHNNNNTHSRLQAAGGCGHVGNAKAIWTATSDGCDGASLACGGIVVRRFVRSYRALPPAGQDCRNGPARQHSSRPVGCGQSCGAARVPPLHLLLLVNVSACPTSEYARPHGRAAAAPPSPPWSGVVSVPLGGARCREPAHSTVAWSKLQ
jgi:hypothetical protein